MLTIPCALDLPANVEIKTSTSSALFDLYVLHAAIVQATGKGEHWDAALREYLGSKLEGAHELTLGELLEVVEQVSACIVTISADRKKKVAATVSWLTSTLQFLPASS